MEQRKVICDFCDRDLTSTSNCVGFRLALVNQHIPSRSNGGSTTLMHVEPILERDHHFCGIGCLGKWIEEPIGGKDVKYE